MDSKVCTKCKVEKPRSEFRRIPDKRCRSGYRVESHCLPCKREDCREYYRRTYIPVGRIEDVPPLDPTGTKVCPRCGVDKRLTEYPRHPGRKQGVGVYCLQCGVERYREKVAVKEVGGELMQHCRTCKQTKPLYDMSRGRQNMCKSCWATYMNEWYKRSPLRSLRYRFLTMDRDRLILATCYGCKWMLPMDQFHMNWKKRSYLCKACRCRMSEDYRQRNMEKVSAGVRQRHYLGRYGITYERKLEMIEMQGGRCAICQSAFDSGPRRPTVDHCHADGRIRGILCDWCNWALGKFNDDPVVVSRALDYITRLA